MPLVWLSRAKGFRHVERVYGPDLMLASYEFSVKQAYRHFFYGGAEGVPEQLATRLQQRFPGHWWLGPTHHLSVLLRLMRISRT
jgi:N-acetylglucosaminyldiphosphoundecaprenol N-acetyl-beta-D-mannosaminyltransferase